MTVKAAVVNGEGRQFEIEDVELDAMRSDEVIVRMVASGICHSDEAIRGGAVPGFPFPVILGHEGAGVVEAVGEQVKGFQKGDQVLIAYNVCKTCPSCLAGHPSSCSHWAELNLGGKRPDGTTTFHKKDGTPVTSLYTESSFSTYSITNQNNLVKVGKDVDLRYIAPLSCGFLTGAGTVANGIQPTPGESIVIFGTGAVGLGAMMMAKIMGCTPIIAVDIHDHRLATAKELGADYTINSKNEDAVTKIRELTNGEGVRYSVDTTGISKVMKDSVDCLKMMGVACPVAVTTQNMTVNPFGDLVLANKTIKGVLMGDNVPQIALPKLVDYYQKGMFPFDKLIKFYNLEDINVANQASISGEVIKPVLIMDKDYRKDEPVL